MSEPSVNGTVTNNVTYIESKKYYSRVEFVPDKFLFAFLGLH